MNLTVESLNSCFLSSHKPVLLFQVGLICVNVQSIRCCSDNVVHEKEAGLDLPENCSDDEKKNEKKTNRKSRKSRIFGIPEFNWTRSF